MAMSASTLNGDADSANGTGHHHHHANGHSSGLPTDDAIGNGAATNGSANNVANGNGSSVRTNGNGATTNSAPGTGDETNAHSGLEDIHAAFVPLYEGSLLDRREFIRITLQSLRELGFESSAKSLEGESGVTLEHPSVVEFRKAILNGEWKNAERSLLDGLKYGATVAAARLASSSTMASSSRHPLSASISAETGEPNIDLVLRNPQSRGLDSIKFLIYQQRYLELLERKETRKALSVLRDRLAPLNYGSERLHQLSSLVICGSSQELRTRANWPGTGTASRRKLLEDIESAISPSVMIPSRRLPQLLEQAQQLQRSRDSYYNLPLNTRLSLYVDHQSDRNIFPTHNVVTLDDHSDEVWHVAFSNDGTKLASAGKDQTVMVWTVASLPSSANCELLHKLGPLTGRTCHVAFSPDDQKLLSTSDDGAVVVWDMQSGEKQEYREHAYTVGSASWLPDGQGFVTGGMDSKIIFWNVDGTQRHTHITTPFRVQALDVSPDGRYLVAISHRYLSAAISGGPSHATGSNATAPRSTASSSQRQQHPFVEPWSPTEMNEEDWTLARSDVSDVVFLGGGSRTLVDERFQIHFYDVQRLEELGSVYMMEEMTSVAFSEDSRHVLINQRPNEAQLWDVERQSLLHQFTGHRIENFVIRSCFGGAENSFVSTGSEDGMIYIYHRKTGKLIERLRGHNKGSVNSVAWNPKDPTMIASCGDDKTVRIWRPVSSDQDPDGFASLSGGAASFYGGGGGQEAGLNRNSRPSLPASGNGHHDASASVGPSTTPYASRTTNGHEGESGSGEGMGPTPFPWATSPRASASRRPVTRMSAGGRAPRRRIGQTEGSGDQDVSAVRRTLEHDEQRYAEGDEEEEEEEEEEDEEEEEEEEEEDDDEAMEEV